jgi:hypothetical protein
MTCMTRSAFETFEHAGYTYELHTDEEPASPAEWDNLGELVAFDPLWREYRFAERNTTSEEDEALERGGFKMLARYLRMTQGITAVPFRYADHGSNGARIYPERTDTESAAGFIYTTDARVDELAGTDAQYHEREWILNALHAELQTWNDYVEGNVVGYVVRSPDGRVLDSVWGFYPEEGNDVYSEVRDEARASAEYHASEDAKASRYMAL